MMSQSSACEASFTNRRFRNWWSAWAVTAVLVLIGLSNHLAFAADQSVDITGISSPGYSPANFTINVNDTVTWTKKDSTGTHHTVTKTGGTGSQTWEPIDFTVQNEFHSIKFTEAGTYTYRCDFHGSMSASFTVAGGPTSPPPTTTTTQPTTTTTRPTTATTQPTTAATASPTATATSSPTASPTASPAKSPTGQSQAGSADPSPTESPTAAAKGGGKGGDDGVPAGLIVAAIALLMATGAGLWLWYLRETPG